MWKSQWNFNIAVSLKPMRRKHYAAVCKIRYLAQKLKQSSFRIKIKRFPKDQNSRIKYTFATIHSLFHRKRCTFKDDTIDIGVQLVSLHINKNIGNLHPEHLDNVALCILFKRNLPNKAFRTIVNFL